jgi:hypothetical protein
MEQKQYNPLVNPKNKMAMLKDMEEERVFYSSFIYSPQFKAKLRLWKFAKITGYDARLESLRSKMTDIENHIISKRKRLYVPEHLTNPFYFDYSDKLFNKESAVINFRTRTSKFKLPDKFSAPCKKEFSVINGYIDKVNASRKNTDKYVVQIAPVKESLRGLVINNAFAMRLTNPDKSITCFYYLNGNYYIMTEFS